MKSLINCIYEAIESDNTLWLLDKWFDMHDEEKQEFMDILLKCMNDHNPNNIEKYLKETIHFKENYKAFINFMLNEVEVNQELDYIYQLKELVKQIIANKSNKNKYIIAI